MLVTTSAYDPKGNLLRETNRSKKGRLQTETQFVYDNKNRLLERVVYRDDGRVIEKANFDYDQNGNLVHQKLIDESGKILQALSFTHDQYGQVTSRVSKTKSVSFHYDHQGNQVRTTIDYDKNDEVDLVLQYTVDEENRRSRLESPLSVTNFEYDEALYTRLLKIAPWIEREQP